MLEIGNLLVAEEKRTKNFKRNESKFKIEKSELQQSANITQNREDEPVWEWGQNGPYTVKSLKMI